MPEDVVPELRALCGANAGLQPLLRAIDKARVMCDVRALVVIVTRRSTSSQQPTPLAQHRSRAASRVH
jgi:hypothetical protein